MPSIRLDRNQRQRGVRRDAQGRSGLDIGVTSPWQKLQRKSSPGIIALQCGHRCFDFKNAAMSSQIGPR
ncbi:MAG: hypothetical protein J7456_13475, partial [Chloroflexus sp.]|nr:hypothetical protein [Chloroflexus sp.]